MKRREFLNAALTLSAAPLISSCLPAALDAFITNYIKDKIEQRENQIREELRKDFEGIKDNVIPLRTSASFFMETDKGIFPMDANVRGKGLIYGDYILTVNRAVSINETTIRNNLSERGMKLVRVEVLSKIIYAGKEPLEQIVAGSEREISILKIPNGYKRPDYKIKFGNSDELKATDKIFTLANTAGDRIIVKEGIVENDGLAEYFGLNGAKFKGKFSSFPVSPREIGSPVINRKGEIVGLVSNSNAFSSTFEAIKGYLEEIEKYEKKKMS